MTGGLASGVTIAGRDGAPAASYACAQGETMLRGALRGQVAFPYECNSGGCGACQFELLSGEVTDRWAQAPGLSARARARGRRLGCQSVPKGDCTIRVKLGEETTPGLMPRTAEAEFLGREYLTEDVALFRFRSSGEARFLPGQFVMFSLAGVDGERAYSMSNLPNAEGRWEFIIKRSPGGRATQVLFESLQKGDPIRIDGPYGRHFLRTDSPRDIVCIAGGSGLSPVMSILRAAVATPQLLSRNIHLFFGGRGPQDLALANLVAEEPALRDRVHVHVAASDPEAPGMADWRGARGFIHDLVRERLGAMIAEFEYYFCGPPAMVDAVHGMLLVECRTPAAQLHFDRYV